MRKRAVGRTRRTVGAVGLGCMGMSWAYNESERDRGLSIALIHEALDLGVDFLDTANIYGDGHNEELVGQALATRRDDAFLCSKVGLQVEDLTTKKVRNAAAPEQVQKSVGESLRRLGTEHIDLCYLHRVDPTVPLADTWGAMAELVEAGKVRYLGLSEVSVGQATLAHTIHPVTAIQSELSLWTRDPLDSGVVDWCARNRAVFVPYSPLGRGFLTGAVTSGDFEVGDIRGNMSRFTDDAMAANMAIVDVVRRVAERHGATAAQVAIAWTLAKGEQIIPIPGTKRSRYLKDNAAAAEVQLSARDMDQLDNVPTPVGGRV